MAETVSVKKDWWSSITPYLTPRMLIILAMGFASGLPLLLTLSTLSYWLSKIGVDKTTIGLFAAVGTPYTLKFLWSPIMDQVPLPVLTRLLGRRRSWLLVTQLLLAAAIFAMGQVDPRLDPWTTALIAVIVASLSASQDIVIDAYRIEFLPKDEQGHGAAATQIGYRIGLLLAGAGAVGLSDFYPWSVVFGVLAAVMIACAVLTLFVPEPKIAAEPGERDYIQWVKESVIDPFGDFVSRRGWVVILLFVLFYKFGDALGGTMANPFYVEMGYTGLEIASISKVWGIWMTIVGAVLGGIAVARWGVFRALLIGGVLQAVTNFAFAYVAVRGTQYGLCAKEALAADPQALVSTLCAAFPHDLPALAIAITADNVAGGAAGAALVAYLSGLCNVAFTATQYALLTSFMAQGRTWLSAGSGWLADHTDWFTFWSATAFLAIPGLLLLLWIMRLYPSGAVIERGPVSRP
ncbi:AmpG family muropeptide MFS transporter [Taklimakanibacter albus]|uniref:AmpG family muropeptide MFS transporter n=1 Tax=Taklimakanibacter albus TaxID=2800327 RepID=A0ACC5RCP9_9HYPH|nr:AmpG family muropeptide MFS transporter [Aestuariivirga sp. YIM B02566]MBK1870414.1 AmpG family muropeptide MFS transporter [Aestuariivirga sp. YIM B02566]